MCQSIDIYAKRQQCLLTLIVLCSPTKFKNEVNNGQQNKKQLIIVIYSKATSD